MSDNKTYAETIVAGDRVHHKTRDSHTWSGRVINTLAAADAEQVALVEVDGPAWARWRLVPLRTLTKEPPPCRSAYSFSGNTTEPYQTHVGMVIVHCDLRAHERAIKHHAKVGPSEDPAEVYWDER